VSPGLRFRPSPDALATRVGDEIVLVHTGTDQIYVLNRTGARIWDLMCAGRAVPEIERDLLGEFDAVPGEVTAQVDDLVASLARGRLIAPRDG
jgi:hypothetical protein